jgi:hypothetical protein
MKKSYLIIGVALLIAGVYYFSKRKSKVNSGLVGQEVQFVYTGSDSAIGQTNVALTGIYQSDGSIKVLRYLNGPYSDFPSPITVSSNDIEEVKELIFES